MNARLNPNQFLKQLASIVNLIPNSPPNWTSESDFEVRTIGLEDGEIMAWVPEREKGELSRPVDYLAAQYCPPIDDMPLTASSLLNNGQILLLMYLFNNCASNRQAVYKRPSLFVERATDLYLLVRFGTTWIGLKTRVVES